jgi:hypothetical protein
MVIGVISWRGDLYDEEKRMDTIFVYCARDDCRGAGRKMAGFRAGRILPDQTTWSPNVDLYVLSFNLSLSLQISLLSIAGAAVAIWLYRKM